jgi:hypothetical protein
MMAKDLVAVARRALTPVQFGDLADVPPELEWLANITNPKTCRALKKRSERIFGLHRAAPGGGAPDYHACSCDRLA